MSSRALPFVTSARPAADDTIDAIVVPVFTGGTIPSAALKALASLGESAVEEIAGRLAPREPGQSCWVSTGPDDAPFLLMCVGSAINGQARPDELRRAAMVAGRTATRPRVACLLAAARAADAESGTIVAEGWVMGAYRFDAYRTDATSASSEEVVMWTCEPEPVETGVIIGEAANAARDLANTPGGDLPPRRMAEVCRELGRKHGFSTRVLEHTELADAGFGGLLAVGAGSVNPPVLIELVRGDPGPGHLALVGKGVTFDSGGLSLKSTAGMGPMKGDMSGAASIVGALVAADRLRLPNHVRAYLACAENMPGGAALRVGDVIRHRNGLTTEVIDTDCEGRLILSDALAFAAESRPSHLIDIATLSLRTGLGPELWAVLATDPQLAQRLLDAGAASGEPGGQLPLWDGYDSRLCSEVADLRNFDPLNGSSYDPMFAALYLRRFIADVPWAHVDLGLTHMRNEANEAWPAGANGNGTRTLVRYIQARARNENSGPAHQPHDAD